MVKFVLELGTLQTLLGRLKSWCRRRVCYVRFVTPLEATQETKYSPLRMLRSTSSFLSGRSFRLFSSYIHRVCRLAPASSEFTTAYLKLSLGCSRGKRRLVGLRLGCRC